MARKFAEFGGNYNIEQVITSLGKDNPCVLEIGCGDGRDAKRIVRFTKNYLGFDISSGMVELAEKRVPQARFLVRNSETSCIFLLFYLKSF